MTDESGIELATTGAFDDVLPQWVAGRRWYVGKGRTPQLSLASAYWLPCHASDDGSGVSVQVQILRDTSSTPPTLYQVPLTYRSASAPELEDALVAVTRRSGVSPRFVYDGCFDPAFARALMSTVLEESESDAATDDGASAVGHRQPGTTAFEVVGCKVLSGEQSNTSIILDTVDATGISAPAIVKVFRVLHDGENPDVVLQSALAAAGSTLVPRPLGYLAGEWPDDAAPEGVARGHLAFAQEFLPGTADAWRVATSAVADGVDFTDRAYALGQATAAVHATLGQVLPSSQATESDREAMLRSWRSRAATALSDVPALAEYEDEIEAVFVRAALAVWPPMQRVHGDYHLGQVLDVPGRGWVLLDFEGEPLRPLRERTRLDQALRDVAGMLRSFDYAAGSYEQSLSVVGGSDDLDSERARARDWAASAREAFLDGYASAPTDGGVVPADPRIDLDQSALLAAFELDKALYEVGYEARNRPTWLTIPTTAVVRILRPPHLHLPTATVTTDKSEAAMSPTEPTSPSKPAADRPAAASSATATATTAATAEPTPVAEVKPASWDELGLLVHGGHGNPHGVLGAHPWNDGVTIRALRPLARSVIVELPDGSTHPMQHDFEGIWQLQLDTPEIPDYRLLVTYEDGYEHRQDDPYRYIPTLGEVDLHLIGEGRHEELWKVLGSHIREYDGPMGHVRGTSFAVWAPNARAIRVTGDFNQWDGTAYPMRALGSSGVWELFIPNVAENSTYKYEILGADGFRRSKADPLARATECPPATASVVTSSTYTWNDEPWMAQRAKADPINEAMSTYEVHLGSWRQGSSYQDLAEHLVNYVRDAGFTHVELLPVAEHPYGPSWGYQVTGYFAPTSRFGSPDEFRYLVDAFHQAGIGVILDWVPAHFPKDGFALGRFDGQPLYEHPDPRRGEHKDWGTYIFDFGRPQVRNFLVANASYWIEEFHIDGLRVDAVASMLYLDYSREDGEWYPNEFGGRENIEAMQLLQETNATLYRRYPGVVTLAEESTSWGGVTKPTYMGGLGFGLKWNMGWMHDALAYISQPSIYRQYHHNELTFAMVYQYSENFCLPISHDEVVYGKGSMIRKMPGDGWEQFAQLRAFYTYMWTHPGKQLLFMGSEFGQYAEWSDSASLDWWLLDHEPHWRLHKLVKDLNWLYRSRPALWQLDNTWEGFTWIDANDASGNCYSFLRSGSPDKDGERPVMASVVNFSGMEHHQYRVGLPKPGVWKEVLNTDSPDYFGGGTGNLGQIVAEDIPWHNQPYSALLTIPKMAAILFEPAGQAPEVEAARAVSGKPSKRAHTRGVSRPELANSPLVNEEAVDSGLGSLPAVVGEEPTA